MGSIWGVEFAHIGVEFGIERGISSWRKRFSAERVSGSGRQLWPWLAGDREQGEEADDVGELISLGICYFGKPKAPSARRPCRSRLSFSLG